MLWSYAILAGLSASVIRAVTMFSLFAIAMQLKRPTNVYNTLAISAFLLLLFKPNFLIRRWVSAKLYCRFVHCNDGTTF